MIFQSKKDKDHDDASKLDEERQLDKEKEKREIVLRRLELLQTRVDVERRGRQ